MHSSKNLHRHQVSPLLRPAQNHAISQPYYREYRDGDKGRAMLILVACAFLVAIGAIAYALYLTSNPH